MNATLLGHLGVWLSGIFALAGMADLALARRRDERSHALIFATLTLLSVAGSVAVMQVALITHNFSLSYVAENNATFTPLIYSITGMWSNLEGSILLWAILLAIATFVTVILYRSRAADAVVQWATGILFAVVAFFALLMAGPADPFVRALTYSPQGAGPNALLQDNPLVAIHPPLLYTGFVGATVPFAFAMAMLITGRVGEAWMVELRRFTVVTWGALSVGIVLGAWWSYQVLGWGGFWGWDPRRELGALTVAHRHGLPALGHRSRPPRIAADVEHGARHHHLRPDDFGHLLHPIGRGAKRSRFFYVNSWPHPHWLLRSHRRCGGHVGCVAW